MARTALLFDAAIQEYNTLRRTAICCNIGCFNRELNISDIVGYPCGELDKIAEEVREEVRECCRNASVVDTETHDTAGGDTSHYSGEARPGDPKRIPDLIEPGEVVLEEPAVPIPQALEDPDGSTAAGEKGGLPMPSLREIGEAQREHPAILPYFVFLSSGTIPEGLNGAEADAFRVAAELVYIDAEDKVLRRTTRSTGVKGPIVLPSQYRLHAFQECHDRQGHLGYSKSWHYLRRLFWWPKARDELQAYITLCRICRRIKVPRHPAGAARISNNGASPWSCVTCDVYDVGWISYSGTVEYTKVLAFVDQFTRGVLAVPLTSNHTSEDIADVIVTMLIRFHGKPASVRSDRGSVLISEVIKHLYSKYKIKMNAGTAYHHEAASICERWFGCLKHMLLTHRAASKDDNWHLYLPLLEMAYNGALNQTTGLSPFFIEHLRHQDIAVDVTSGRPHNGQPLKAWVAEHLERMILVWEVVARRLGINALNRKKAVDMKREQRISYVPGQQVLLVKGRFVDGNLPKIEEPTEGPFTVLSCAGQGNCVLGNLRSQRMHEVIHESRLLPYPTRRLNTLDEIAQRGCVDRICGRKREVDKRTGETIFKYRVRWMGYTKISDSWRTADELQEVAPLVAAYNELQPLPSDAQQEVLTSANVPMETPATTEAAMRVPHFRALHGGTIGVTEEEPAIPYEEQFPVGSRAEMLYENEDGTYQWYEGVITRSKATEDKNGGADLSYSIKFPGEPVRPYKLSRNSLRPLQA